MKKLSQFLAVAALFVSGLMISTSTFAQSEGAPVATKTCTKGKNAKACCASKGAKVGMTSNAGANGAKVSATSNAGVNGIGEGKAACTGKKAGKACSKSAAKKTCTKPCTKSASAVSGGSVQMTSNAGTAKKACTKPCTKGASATQL